MFESVQTDKGEDERPPIKNEPLSTTIYADDQVQLSFMKKPLKSTWAESDTKDSAQYEEKTMFPSSKSPVRMRIEISDSVNRI